MSTSTAAARFPLGRITQLYSLPAVAMEVLQLTADPQVDTRALKDCIERDPALTGKILRVVNSSLFGLHGTVSDLNQALTLLGCKPLKLLVLGFSLPTRLFDGIEADTLGQYWRRTLIKAVAGRELGESLFLVPGDEAFIAGLLQDLGVLLLIQELGEPYAKFLRSVTTGGKDLESLEIDAMGFEHTALTAELLSRWGLPETLVEAVAWQAAHRDRPVPPWKQPMLPQILHLAELLARLLADNRPEALSALLAACRKREGFSEAKLEALVERLSDKVAQLADVLNLTLPEGRDCSDLLIQAHGQLAFVAAEAASEMAGEMAGGRSSSFETPQDDSICADLAGLAKALAEASHRTTAPDEPTSPGSGPAEHLAPDRSPFASPHPQADVSPSTPPLSTPPLSTPPRPTGGAAMSTLEADPGMLGRLTSAVAACRQARCPLSLLMVQLDGADELVLHRGVEGFARFRQALQALCQDVDHPGAVCVAYGNAGFAVILPDCERRAAIRTGNLLVEQAGSLTPDDDPTTPGVGLCVGVATVSLPPRNFPAADLLTAAERCLYGSAASGGGVVKSIEIY